MGVEPETPRTNRAGLLTSVLGWGLLGGLNAATGTVVGLGIGSAWYPRQYSQFPVAFFYLPAACIAGFVAGAAIRATKPHWTSAQRSLAMLALTVCCAGLMVESARDNAPAASVGMRLFPNRRVQAVACSNATCPTADPPWHWTVQGSVLVVESTKIGGRIDSIELVGQEHEVIRPYRWIAETTRVRYSSRQIRETVGTDHLEPGGSLEFPLSYTYRTTTGTSAVSIQVDLHFTDRLGRALSRSTSWQVP